jgi:hypothetical protein
MCTGVEWALVGAVASAASSAIGSVAQYQQQQAEYQYQVQARNYAYQAEVQAQEIQRRNEEAQINYKYQVDRQAYEYQNQLLEQDYQNQMRAYEASQQTYRDQISLNQQAANRAYESEQLKLSSERKKAAQDAQTLFIQKMQAQGQVLAAGRSGQGIGLLVSDAERVYGRDLAMLGTNLGYATEETLMGLENIFLDQRTADLRAASQRMLEPMKPLKGPEPVKMPMSSYAAIPQPIQPTKPGAGSLVAGIGQSVIGGVGVYAGGKAPGAKIGG